MNSSRWWKGLEVFPIWFETLFYLRWASNCFQANKKKSFFVSTIEGGFGLISKLNVVYNSILDFSRRLNNCVFDCKLHIDYQDWKVIWAWHHYCCFVWDFGTYDENRTRGCVFKNKWVRLNNIYSLQIQYCEAEMKQAFLIAYIGRLNRTANLISWKWSNFNVARYERFFSVFFYFILGKLLKRLVVLFSYIYKYIRVVRKHGSKEAELWLLATMEIFGLIPKKTREME